MGGPVVALVALAGRRLSLPVELRGATGGRRPAGSSDTPSDFCVGHSGSPHMLGLGRYASHPEIYLRSRMDLQALTLLGTFVIFSGALLGFFWRMQSGFGPYNLSALLLLVVLAVTAIALITGKCEPQTAANIIFAVVGFAGGLFVKKD